MRRVVSFFFFWLLFSGFILGMFALTIGYWNIRQETVAVSLENPVLSGPRDVLTVRFSQSVRPQSFEDKILIVPAQALRLEWHDGNRTLLLIPEEHWPLDTSYELSIGSGTTKWLGTTPSTRFRIESPAYPKLVGVFPEDNAKDVLLGIEDPLRVTFDRSVKDFFIDFRMEPGTEMIYQNNPEKTQFELLPKETLPAGTPAQLSIYAKWRGEPDQTYQWIGQTSFTTLPAKRELTPTNFATRIDEAKRFTPAKKTEGKYIDINIANQVMTLFENGQALDAYMISSGKRGMDTPTGEFAVQNKALRPWSKRYGLYLPYWQAITPDGLYGIHELPEWPGGYKEGENHLGIPVSHGCVRLGVGAAERLYAWSEVGTPIVIY